MYRLFFILLFLFIPLYFSSSSVVSRAEVVFFDVGQGDAFALKTPQGKIIAVDGGPDLSALYGWGRWLGWKRTIDILIISHGHSDHLAALPELVTRYQIKQALLPPGLSGIAAQTLLSGLRSQGTAIIYPQSETCWQLEPACSLCIFPPTAEFLKADDENDWSLALHFNCDGLSLAAAGDANRRRELALLSSGFLWQAQIFKASHHGADTSNDPYFVARVKPAVVVISVGADNTYGHPSPELINSLRVAGIKVWRTDEQGSVIFYANNKKINYRGLGF